jgi:hypothetical protein|tara:strand:+ start:7783 stop:8634 length:852 start_codon:yes stop_codon:yes gene_type:complete
MEDIYKIKGTSFLNPPDEYKEKTAYPNFNIELNEFKDLLTNQVKQEQSATYFKFGDGDYFFLKKESVGSAKPGNRALSKSYWRINHKEFVNGSKKNDYYLCEILNQNESYFSEIFNKNYDFPAEYVYGLVANKWLLKTFAGKIGIIGATEKIELIKTLLERKEYQDYLGLDKFEDYISIPQKFACDNIRKTRKLIKNQLANSTSKIFLLGVGHVKSGLTHLLPTYKNAVYLDIGSGVDAIAGIIDKRRPYFYNWDNYKLKNNTYYKNIDFLQFNYDGSEIEIP